MSEDETPNTLGSPSNDNNRLRQLLDPSCRKRDIVTASQPPLNTASDVTTVPHPRRTATAATTTMMLSPPTPPRSLSSSSVTSNSGSQGSSESDINKRKPVKQQPQQASREELRRQVYRAFCEIPESEKTAYVQAMEKAPDLVLKESDPIRFLKREAGNAHAAASLLATYWTKRMSLFGDRSLLPMNLTGNGALSTSDIAVLKGGSQVFLPTDSKGRTVLYIDDSRDGKNEAELDAKDARLAKFRCAFALYTQAAQEGKPVVMVRFSNYPRMDKKKSGKMCEMFEYMPVKLDSMICLYAPSDGATSPSQDPATFSVSQLKKPPPPLSLPRATPPTGGAAATAAVAAAPHGQVPLQPLAPKVKESVANFNPLFEDYRGKKCFLGVLHNVVGGDTPEETLVTMQKHGFSKEGLPVSAGGTWLYANHESWVDRRQERELVEERLGLEKAAALHEFAKLAALSGGPKKRRASSSASSDKLKAAALASVSHKKTKQLSSSVAAAAMAAPVDDLLPAIARLAAATSNARGLQRKDRKRRLDVIYSRNRRQREKREEHDLQAQCADLKRANASLKRGEKRLLHLLADAHKAIDDHVATTDEVTEVPPARGAELPPASGTAAYASKAPNPESKISSASATGISAGDLQAILQLLSQQEAAKALSAPPPPQPVAPPPTPAPMNGAEVLLPIMQRMLMGQEMGSQDILAVIMMLVGHLQKASHNEVPARRPVLAPTPPPQSPSNDALLLQLLGAVMKGEQQQMQLAQAQQLQRQQQQQQQQQQLLQEANLISSLLAQLQGLSAPVPPAAAPPTVQHHPSSSHQTSHEALLHLLMSQDLPHPTRASAGKVHAPAPVQQLDVRQRQVPKLVHRHSESSGSASSLSDRDSNPPSDPPPQHRKKRDHHKSTTNYMTPTTTTANPNPPEPQNTSTSSDNVNNHNNGGGLDILQFMLALSNANQHPSR